MAINWPADCATLRDKAELMCIAKRRCIEEHNAARGPAAKEAWLLRLRVVDALICVALEKYGDRRPNMTEQDQATLQSWLAEKRQSTRWTIPTNALEKIDYFADRKLVAQMQGE